MAQNATKTVPLHETIIERLYQYIDQSNMAPGSSFPPERELAKLWGVSRNVVREAMLILEQRGLVVSRQGQGRFLRERPATAEADGSPVSGELTRYSLIDLYEVCQCLEGKAVALAALQATDEQIRETEQFYLEFCRRMYRSGSIRQSRELSMHLQYLEMVNNLYLKSELSRLIFEREAMFDRLDSWVDKHTVEDYVRDHGNILRAIRNHDPEEAKREMERHLQETIDILKSTD